MRKYLALSMLAACALALRPARAQDTGAASTPGVPRVVFVFPHEVDQALRASLREALEAQFSGMNAELVFRNFETAVPDLRSQAHAARELARTLSARAVFWVEASAGQDVLVYLSEPDAERILVRRLQMESSSSAAAAEVVSIITRESTAALLSGHTIGMQPVNVDPLVPSPRPAPAPPEAAGTKPPVAPDVIRDRAPRHPSAPSRGPISVDLGYQGNAYAPQEGWQNGVRFGMRWQIHSGFYAGAAYVLYEPVDVESDALALEVTRHPAGIAAGWRFSESSIGLLTEVGYAADILTRRLVRDAEGVERAPDEVRVVSMVTPRVVLEYDMTAHLSLLATVGTDVAVNGFEFVTQAGDQQRALLSPYRVRAVAGVGVSFRP